MKRRTFIKNTVTAGLAAGVGSFGLLSFSESLRRKHITILHTNDVHSHIDPFDQDHPQFAGRGGVSRRYELIQSIRGENPNTLLLDAGDIFQGTPYFNFYGGELEFKLMSKLGYDAATIGNHEFDNGIDGFAAQLPNADFKFLNANYDFSNTILDGLIQPYKVFVKDGIRIGVFGLGIELAGLVGKKLYRETVYLDPIEIATDTTKSLREEEKCDLVICLSHLGYQYKAEKISDVKLAAQTRDIDLIIGGHTHTFLPEPQVIENLDQKAVIVNQVGWAGLNLGRIDFHLDNSTKTSGDGVRIVV